MSNDATHGESRIDDISTDGAMPNFEAWKKLYDLARTLEAELEQEKDIRTTREIILGMVAEGLRVAPEPHQTFDERLLEASCSTASETGERAAALLEAAAIARESYPKDSDYDVKMKIAAGSIAGTLERMAEASPSATAAPIAVEDGHGGVSIPVKQRHDKHGEAHCLAVDALTYESGALTTEERKKLARAYLDLEERLSATRRKNQGGMMPNPCNCPRYSWPHRRGSGSCIWNPVNDEMKCRDCGRVCKVIYSEHKYPMSACCGGEMVVNGTLVEAG